MLKDLVYERIGTRRLSVREASREIGIAHTTLNRFLGGDEMDLKTVEAMAKWMGMTLATALGVVREEGTLSDQVTALIESEPKLAKLFAEAAEDMKKGELSADDFREVIEYAVYKFGKRRNSGAEGRIS